MALKILLADDSMTAQNMGKKILSDAGYEVLTVSNGAAAVKKIAEVTPDIALLDVYMPGYSGLEVCERIKNTAATARVPVLLTVGKMEPFRPEDGMKAKADGVIIKPFEATDLVTVIDKLASRAYGATAVKPAPAASVANTMPAADVPPGDVSAEMAGGQAIEEEAEPAPRCIVDEDSEPVFSAAGLENFTREDELASVASEPHIEFTAAPKAEVATERISGLVPTVLQDIIPAENATEDALDSFGSGQHSAFSTRHSGYENALSADAGVVGEGSEPVWESVDTEPMDEDAAVDLEAEMRRAQAQSRPTAEGARAEDAQAGGEPAGAWAMAAGAGTGTGPRNGGVPLLAPIGKTSFDEFDSIMAETASRFEASAASAAKADDDVVPEHEAVAAVSPANDTFAAIPAENVELELESGGNMLEEASEEASYVPSGSAVLEQPDSARDDVQALPESVFGERQDPVFMASSTMRGSDGLSGVFELDAPKSVEAAESFEPELEIEQAGLQHSATLAGEEDSELAWATIVPERVEREFSLPSMEGAVDTAADAQVANNGSAAEELGRTTHEEPIPAVNAAGQPNISLDQSAMNTMVERVVDRVLERLKPVLVVTVEEILKEFKR